MFRPIRGRTKLRHGSDCTDVRNDSNGLEQSDSLRLVSQRRNTKKNCLTVVQEIG